FSLSVGNFLRNAWNKEPVVAAACGLGFLALIVPLASPFTKYTGMMNKAIPYNYPGKGSNVPVRDDGNMPDVPAHPCDPLGRSLDWLKNL
uniref:NADH dehydrogenase [ubiquinone] 1 alpha subcomplex subunit 3 n=1 Tax=Pygocentrus nattereri TaxID=42514 RepID=A0A3B4E4X4_PYGNA